MRIFITGATGFVGPHVLEKFRTLFPSAIIRGYGDSQSAEATATVDLRDIRAIRLQVEEFQPTHVLHLAAISNVPQSIADPITTWAVNTTGAINLFTVLGEITPHPKVISVSSSEVYGASFKDARVTEDTALRPMNPYAASKAAIDAYVLQLILRGYPYVIARPFNHVGAGQSTKFVLASFAQQIAIAESVNGTVRVGNMNAERDFLHVSSVADAYGKIFSNYDDFSGTIVNICSGTTHRIGDLLQNMVALSNGTIQIEADPVRIRPLEIKKAASEPSVSLIEAGWSPQFDTQRTLEELLSDARRRL